MPVLCLLLLYTYYANNFAGKIDAFLVHACVFVCMCVYVFVFNKFRLDVFIDGDK